MLFVEESALAETGSAGPVSTVISEIGPQSWVCRVSAIDARALFRRFAGLGATALPKRSRAAGIGAGAMGKR